MKTNDAILKIILPLLLAMTVSGDFRANAQDHLPRGEIIDKVICKDKPDQSYVLYLPKDYSRDKEWPILFAFDPGARGKRPVELFKSAAEKYGFIVVGSNNSKNGPYYIADQAIFAMWKDTRQRFAVDSRRIYSTGFSGGARVATRFHMLTGKACAGIIACGAGLPNDFGDLGTLKPAAWYGIVGLADFNYHELLDLEKTLDHTAIIHQVDVIDAEHRWPPEEPLARAVEWLEINAMKSNARPKDDSLAQALYQGALTRANNLELAGNIPFAAGAYDWAQRLFNGLLDTSYAEKKKILLTGSKAYKKFQQDEIDRGKKVSTYIKSLAGVFYFIENPQKKRVSLEEIFQELQLADLQKLAKRKKDIFDSGFAFRVMAGFGNAAYEKGSEYFRNADYEKAILCFGISAYVEERTYYSAYNLACSYSLNKQKKPALKALELAMKRGLNNPAQLDNDKDLDFIRGEKAFKEIRQKMESQTKTAHQ
ncbi:MAG: hypothetical protein NT166_30220 [Candidatus Aminicenantes bacterium]|nr:hypothetical protein [Candidatus Aminicenantes bacterium]